MFDFDAEFRKARKQLERRAVAAARVNQVIKKERRVKPMPSQDHDGVVRGAPKAERPMVPDPKAHLRPLPLVADRVPVLVRQGTHKTVRETWATKKPQTLFDKCHKAGRK